MMGMGGGELGNEGYDQSSGQQNTDSGGSDSGNDAWGQGSFGPEPGGFGSYKDYGPWGVGSIGGSGGGGSAFANSLASMHAKEMAELAERERAFDVASLFEKGIKAASKYGISRNMRDMLGANPATALASSALGGIVDSINSEESPAHAVAKSMVGTGGSVLGSMVGGSLVGGPIGAIGGAIAGSKLGRAVADKMGIGEPDFAPSPVSSVQGHAPDLQKFGVKPVTPSIPRHSIGNRKPQIYQANFQHPHALGKSKV